MKDTEEAARHLFEVAAGDIPPGIDLLGGVRRARRRTRTRVLLSTGATGIVAAGAAITVSAAGAPSALAQVTGAATRTAAQSYQVRSAITPVTAAGSTVTISGTFDPARGVGLETSSSGLQYRYLGGYVYLPMPEAYRDAYRYVHHAPIPAGKSWLRLPGPLRPSGATAWVDITQLSDTAAGLDQVNPQDLLALLESSSQVREVGPASGPGWTGTAYTFTATQSQGSSLHAVVLRISGTVDVDRQGRVRRLDALASTGKTANKVAMTFGEFGTRVMVSPPPAGQTFTP